MWSWRRSEGRSSFTEPSAPKQPPPAPSAAANTSLAAASKEGSASSSSPAVTDSPSGAAGTFGTPFFGCADVHTPHFGVTHSPLEPDLED